GEKKKKVEKDPNAPKRNLSSYMLYSQAVRPNMVEKHPDLKAVEIAKLIGEQWNALSDKEKQPYIKQAEKEKVRFVKETKSYQASLVANNSDASSSDETSTEKRKAEQTTEKKDKKKAKKSSSDEKKSSSDDKKKSSHKKK
ncbi:high mobility group box domain-containing protein, partial [Cokeromyces recurvatus]|uniref:high mobility group box domain-containing protein n=1 Tax=Cokeromyces recurvatus TaxID=90255 RepID=UPI00221F2391